MIKRLLKEQIQNLYENKVKKGLLSEANELVSVFAAHNKLSWNLEEDIKYIDNFYRLLTEDDNFDPFSHLKDTGKIDEEEDCVLTISQPNSKLGQIQAPSLSLPAGYTCPFANICKSVARKPGSSSEKAITDLGTVRCFAASDEMVYPSLKRMRWRNFDLLQDTHRKSGISGVVDLLVKSIAFYEQKKGNIRVFRIHDSGDFFKQWYLDAWIEAAKAMPEILFYAYTKSLPFWKERKSDIPKNLRLIASEGGKADELIGKEGFRKAVIVKDMGEAIEKKLNVDVNDFLAAFGDKDFALLMHGTQSAESKNTKQARANSKMIKDAAAKFKTSPKEIEKLIQFYTS